MKRNREGALALITLGALLLPELASAQAFSDVTTNVVNFVDTYVINLLYAIAFVGFLIGVFRYFFLESGDEHARGEGRNFILWGLIGLFVLFTVWGLVKLLMSALTLTP